MTGDYSFLEIVFDLLHLLICAGCIVLILFLNRKNWGKR